MDIYTKTADAESDGSAYLTITGTSAECGDDGTVGRGNRVTGLTTPFRHASLEAAAGKNPISHVGNLYNILAFESAKRIVDEVGGIRQAEVILLSQIGRPVDQPLVASVIIYPEADELADRLKEDVTHVLDECLANINWIRKKLANPELLLFSSATWSPLKTQLQLRLEPQLLGPAALPAQSHQ